VPNYYAAFVSLSVRKLKKKGQLVFITPRSFCNGKYFKSFRNDLLNHIRIEKIHNFVSRNSLFYDNILQETIITLVSKNKQVLNDNIYIYESVKSDFSNLTRIQKRFDNIVFPDDHEKIIRIIKDDNIGIVNKINSLPCKLEQLNISVSTGPIVDFRVKKGLLSFENTQVAVPIIYPENFCCGYIEWPINGKKPPYLIKDISNINQLRPQGIYVLVKRVSSKEETKRIVAAVCYTDLLNNLEVGFDNKTNYYHISKQGLGSVKLAKGLSLFLNSSLVDFYFRTFSGSTQVNVSDLKSLKYPSLAQLEQLGSTYSKTLPTQVEIDNLINMILFK
ncbi:MAG: hypothetical protein K0S80_4281, partial [Neobacillus sp.]|nr:hypothetical protein [Neobacillus sp.]